MGNKKLVQMPNAYNIDDDCIIIKKKSYEDLLNNLTILETDLQRCKAEIINLRNYIKYLRKAEKNVY